MAVNRRQLLIDRIQQELQNMSDEQLRNLDRSLTNSQDMSQNEQSLPMSRSEQPLPPLSRSEQPLPPPSPLPITNCSHMETLPVSVGNYPDNPEYWSYPGVCNCNCGSITDNYWLYDVMDYQTNECPPGCEQACSESCQDDGVVESECLGTPGPNQNYWHRHNPDTTGIDCFHCFAPYDGSDEGCGSCNNHFHRRAVCKDGRAFVLWEGDHDGSMCGGELPSGAPITGYDICNNANLRAGIPFVVENVGSCPPNCQTMCESTCEQFSGTSLGGTCSSTSPQVPGVCDCECITSGRTIHKLGSPVDRNHSRRTRVNKSKLQYGGIINGEMCIEGTKIKYTGRMVNIGGTHYTTKTGTLEGKSKKLYNC
tara:strand:+ start:122 stop:1222 length:1101 start_codon:yes stop_codon:yes gene_type:complete